MSNSMWVYERTEPHLFTVGFYDTWGKWHGDTDHDTREAAAARVSYLNGGPPATSTTNEREQHA